MDPSLTIRSATRDEDLAQLQQLARVIWREHYPGILSLEQIESMLDRMYSLDVLKDRRDNDSVTHDLAWVGSNPIGYSAYGLAPGSNDAKLHSLYVRSDARGLGCGRALLDRALTWAREHGHTTIMLTVNKRNTSAIEVYRHCGFRLRESIVTEIGDGFVMDDHVMELSL